MLNIKNWGLSSVLAASITATDNKIKLPVSSGAAFKVPSSDHFYITVKDGSKREFMKVTSVAGDVLFVDRGVDGSTATSFGKGSCVKVEWNPSQLCEFVQGCVNGEPKKTIEPQTVCFSCDTCFEVDEGGHIISVNGGGGC